LTPTDKPTECPIKSDWKAVTTLGGLNCEDAGYSYINNEADCKIAHEQLGNQYLMASNYNPAPQGCYQKTAMWPGQFSTNAVNTGNGAVGERTPVCKSYGTAFSTHHEVLAYSSFSTESCLMFGKTWKAPKMGKKLELEHIAECYEACRANHKCGGWAWDQKSRSQCTLFKKRKIRNLARVDYPGITSASKDCDYYKA